MLDAGFAVTAVDVLGRAMRIVGAYPEMGTAASPRCTRPMQDAVLPAVDLLYAGYSLPFCAPEHFDAAVVAVRTVASLGAARRRPVRRTRRVGRGGRT